MMNLPKCFRCRQPVTPKGECGCRDGVCLIHADCRDVLPLLEAGSVDLVLTDPPYGIGWDTNYSRFTHKSADKPPIVNDATPFDPSPLLPFSEVILWGANHYAAMLPAASWLVWDKRNADGTSFLADAEVAWWSEGHGVYLKSLSAQKFRASNVGKSFHPTQKPVPLMAWCIQKAKATGVILDPYVGSGSTLVAAKTTGRQCVGIEIEEKYCEIAAGRLEQEVLFT